MKILKSQLKQIIKEEIQKLVEIKKIKTEDIGQGLKIIDEYINSIKVCSKYKKDDPSSVQASIDNFKKALAKGNELSKALFHDQGAYSTSYVPARSFNPYQQSVFQKLFDLENYCINYIKGGWGFKGFFDSHSFLFQDRGSNDQESFLQILNECKSVLESFTDQASTEIDLGV